MKLQKPLVVGQFGEGAEKVGTDALSEIGMIAECGSHEVNKYLPHGWILLKIKEEGSTIFGNYSFLIGLPRDKVNQWELTQNLSGSDTPDKDEGFLPEISRPRTPEEWLFFARDHQEKLDPAWCGEDEKKKDLFLMIFDLWKRDGFPNPKEWLQTSPAEEVIPEELRKMFS